MSKLYHATNQPGTCLWCGHTLQKAEYRETPGYQGNGFFCTLRCGLAFAVRLAETGKRLQPKADRPAPRARLGKRKPRCPGCHESLLDVTDHMHAVPVFRCGTTTCISHKTGESFDADGQPITDAQMYGKQPEGG